MATLLTPDDNKSPESRFETELRSLCREIDSFCAKYPSRFLLTDSNVAEKVFPLLRDAESLAAVPMIVIPAGEESKTPESLLYIWRELSRSGATRNSLLINLGGGMITDLGGFAAATFKRGIPALNIPTTLLGAVDAAFGGKTGCDLDGLKNEVGVFAEPAGVILSTLPFLTLPREELLSGLGELLKTGLIRDGGLYRSLLSPGELLRDPLLFSQAMEQAVKIKREVVSQDPREAGLRKILNFGHTVGHAFETRLLELGHPQPHGIAVAHGLLVEMILSHTQLGFPSSELYPYAELLKDEFPKSGLECKETERLLELMAHDKKNLSPDRINFTLLEDIARPQWDCHVDRDDIQAALDIYRDLIPSP